MDALISPRKLTFHIKVKQFMVSQDEFKENNKT